MPRHLYHAGIGLAVARSTLAEANESRDWRIWADFAQVLIAEARQLHADESFGVPLKANSYAFDTTTIDLCLTLFPWAQFRRHKSAVKMHTLLDLRGHIPCFISITGGAVHEVNVLDELVLEAGAYYMMDRGFIDFARLYRFTQGLAFFVTRAKDNMDYRVRESRPVDLSHRLARRSEHPPARRQHPPALSRVAAAREFHGPRHRQESGVPEQQLHAGGLDHRPALPLPLAGGIVFQMDQAESADQGVLRHLGERRQDAVVDRHQRLRAASPSYANISMCRRLWRKWYRY